MYLPEDRPCRETLICKKLKRVLLNFVESSAYERQLSTSVLGWLQHSVQVFQTSTFCKRNLVAYLSCGLQTISIQCLFHPQRNVFIWCGDTCNLVGHIFRLTIEHCVLGCCHCWGKSSLDWTGFSLLKRKVIRPWRLYRHVTVALGLFRLWGQFLVESPTRCPWNSPQECPSICFCHRLPFYTFRPDPSRISKVDRRCPKRTQVLHKVPGCVCFTYLANGAQPPAVTLGRAVATMLHYLSSALTVGINCRYYFPIMSFLFIYLFFIYFLCF